MNDDYPDLMFNIGLEFLEALTRSWFLTYSWIGSSSNCSGWTWHRIFPDGSWHIPGLGPPLTTLDGQAMAQRTWFQYCWMSQNTLTLDWLQWSRIQNEYGVFVCSCFLSNYKKWVCRQIKRFFETIYSIERDALAPLEKIEYCIKLWR